MCLSPITIPNPFYGLGKSSLYRSRSALFSFDHRKSNNFLHNTHDTHIQVPCGQCIQCTSLRQSFVNQRVQMESLRSHLFFFTLTYNDRSLFHTNCGDYQVSYPYYSDVQNMFKRLRSKGYKFRYYVVSEYGTDPTKTKRPHYHGILAIEKSPDDDKFTTFRLETVWFKRLLSEWRRNYGSTRSPIWDNLCDFKVAYRGGKRNSTYDLHYIEPCPNHDNDVSFYVSKYCLKYDSRVHGLIKKIAVDNSLDDQQTKYLISKIKPRSIMSKDFGDYKLPEVKDYILRSLSCDDKLPTYIDINTGKRSLLSRYYSEHLIPDDWLLDRYFNYSQMDWSLYMPEEDDQVDWIIKSEKAKFIQEKTKSIKQALDQKYF